MIVNKYKGNGGGGSGERGPQGPQGPQGPAGSGEQLPVECPDVQLLLDICDGKADVAVRLRDAAGNLLGNFSTTNDPYSIYFEGEYAGGLYQVEFEGKWSDENIHFIYDCDGTYESGAYNISKAFDKISIDLIHDEDTGEYNIEFNINYVGGGGSYVLPAATQSTLGGVKVGVGLGVEPDGELWVNVDDILPAMDRLQRVIEFPSDANIGDAVAKIRQEDEEITVEGELFNDGIDLTGKQASYIYVDDANGVEFSFNGGRWSISWENETFNLNLVDGEDNITGVYTFQTKGDSEDGWTVNITDGDENGVWSMFIAKVYEITDYGFGSDYTVPAGREGTVNYKEDVTKDIPEGVYQLSNDGQCAEWSSPSTEWGDGAGWSLAFSYIPEGQVILAVEKRYSSANNGKHTIKYEKGVINVYNNNDEIEQTIEKDGVAHRVLYTTLPNSYYLWVLYKDNYIGFNLIGGLQIYSDIWDGTTKDQYWKKIGLPKPMAYFYNKPAAGIYNVDNEGKVTSLNYEPSHKAIYINSNENSSIYYLDALIKSGGNNLPSRIWAPTSSGTAGQVLTSSGNGAPEWSTMIKAQQITSAAYEALATKDPNTLYLIVDE